MVEKIPQTLNGIPETLLITLYTRACESQRPDTMLKDDRAIAIVNQLECDFSRLRLQGHDEIALIIRTKKFDSLAQDFLRRNPVAVIVHIGCGLDTRFERVDNGQVEWFDLDLPEVIELRHKVIRYDNERHHTLATSMFNPGWLEQLSQYRPRPFFFMAEGVFPYFEESQLKPLFLKLQNCFPGSELACDAHTPFVVRMDNLQLALSKVSARLHWGLKHGKDVESWGEGIRLLEEWFYFDDPEPRMRPYRWMGRIPLLGKSTGIFHYQLGSKMI